MRSGRLSPHYWALGAALLVAALVVLASSPAIALTATLPDTDRPHIQYGNWAFGLDDPASDGWEIASRTTGATTSFSFRGTSVTWKTVTYDGGGITDIYLDGKKVSSFDGYSNTGSTIYDVTGFSKKGLKDKRHTLTLVVSGLKHPGTFGDIFTISDRFIVKGKTIEENSPKIAYDGWIGKANRNAEGGFYRESTSQTLSARCGSFRGSNEINLITAAGPTRGMATVRARNTSTNIVDTEQTVDLNSSAVDWQHVVPISVDSTKTYVLEVTSADGAPVVFDGCNGNVVATIN